MRERIYYQAVAIIIISTCVLILAPLSNAQDLKSIISDALNKGDTANAIILLNNDIEVDKTYHLNYFYLGKINFERSQYEDAVVQFEIALSKKKKHYESLYYLALSQLRLGNLEIAEEKMNTGMKKDKKNKHRFEDGLGQVMLAQEKYRDADRLFRQAIINNPNNANYHIHLGDANFYQGIPSLAISEYEKALEVDTASLEVYFHWAEACLEMKDFTCAIDKLKVVLTKDSTYAPAWNRAAGIYYKAARSSRSRDERKNRFMETIGAYKKYLVLKYVPVDTVHLKGFLELAKVDYNKAYSDLLMSSSVSVDSTNIKIFYDLAMVDYSKALERYNEISQVQADSSNVRVFFELAMSYVNINGFEDAADYFNKVLSIPMEPKDIYFNLGKSYWGIRDYAKSGELLLKHIDWVSQQDENYHSNIREYELYQLLGDSYYYRNPKDFSTAINYYKKSLEIRPEQRRIVQNIAVGYHSLKSYAQALEYYDKRIEFGIDEKSASLIKNAGYCALNIANNSGDDDDEEDFDEEEEMVEETVVDDRNYFEVAISYFIKYLEYKADDAKILTAIANTYLYQLTDIANGVKYFEQVAALEPDNCDAKKSLGYAFFGFANKNYTKALGYLRDANSCFTKDGECTDGALILWIAQCYHLRAAEKVAAEKDANEDFKAAFNWYGKVLKCEPNHTEAKKGQNDVRFEFVD